MHPNTKRRRIVPRRRVPLWVEELLEKHMPPRGTDPEGRAAFDAWRRGASVAGLPPIESVEGQELIQRCRSTNLRG
jgi:hypothetical protein